jgi:DNA-binding beta-propeller fold protein YncE
MPGRVRPDWPGAVRGCGARGAVNPAAGLTRKRRIGRAAVLAVMACGLAAGCTAAGARAPAGPPAGAPFVYVTGKGGTNEISQFASLGSGALRPLTPGNVASGEFPYDVAVSPRGTSAYAVDSLSNTAGAVSQYTLNRATGKLTPMPPRKVAGAGFPIGIKVAPDGRYLYFVSGVNCFALKGSKGSRCAALAKASTVSVFGISPATGALSSAPVQTVPTGLGPQMITIAPGGTSAYVAATGASTIWQYSINPATGKLTPKSPASVAGGGAPHDLAVAPDGKNLYVVNNSGATIAQYAISPATGALSARPVSAARTVPAPEALALSPDGKNAYVTSEGDGALSQFAISPVTGKITPLSPATVTAPSHGSLGVAVTP